MEKFLEFYSESKKRIETKITEYNKEIQEEDIMLLQPFAEDLADLNSGGKLLRGVFVNLGYKIAGGKNLEESDWLSVAFEMFQTAVLIHDDIIDHAELRRGKETVHKRYEKSIAARQIDVLTKDTPYSAALCVGDLGLYRANKLIADKYSDDPKLGKLISYFNYIVLNTIRGELLDVILPCEVRNPKLSEPEASALLEKSVMQIYHLKTALYSVIGPIHLGMLLGDMDEQQMAMVDEYSDKIGIAFQIKDDILGIFSSEDEIGKSISADIEEAKITVLYQYVEQNDPEALKRLKKHYGKSSVTSEDIKAVQDIFRSTGALEHAEMVMNRCYDEGKEILVRCPFLLPEDKEILLGIGEYFLNRTY